MSALTDHDAHGAGLEGRRAGRPIVVRASAVRFQLGKTPNIRWDESGSDQDNDLRLLDDEFNSATVFSVSGAFLMAKCRPQ